MKHFTLFILLLSATCAYAQDILTASNGKWRAEINDRGFIKKLQMDFGNGPSDIFWHSEGEYAGPAFQHADETRKLSKTGDCTYTTQTESLGYALSYSEENGIFSIKAMIENRTPKMLNFGEKEASLCLGINTVMSSPKMYHSTFFPTLLRCEKTHFWGYFQTPDGKVLAIVSPQAVASWHLDYIGKGHRIGTAGIDLLHKLPLPVRHPQHLSLLQPGEKKTWTFYLIPLSHINQIPQAISQVAGIPALDMERTSVAPGETTDFTVCTGDGESPKVCIISPEGKSTPLTPEKQVIHTHKYTYIAPNATGTYKLQVSSKNYCSEGNLYIRRPWSWYLQQAGKEALRMEQKSMQHREGWMGFFTAYWSHVYFPNAIMLQETEEKFEEFWKNMVDPQTGFYYTNKKTWYDRPQNTSWMIAVLVARYAATKRIEHLELAAQWADFLIDKFQLPNGAYRGYTALTLGAKFLQELMWFEKPLADKSHKWKEYYERHSRSVQAASQNVLAVKDMGATEGEATYEDNQAGSAWSLLAMHALTETNSDQMSSMLQAGREIQKHHECLTQAFIPDSRMRGGSLRWWEAQYDVLIRKNMMTSPHGWTMRSQFGALYLYLLTGEEHYLNVAFDAMASCAQAIDHNSGILRWAFVPDPYVSVKRFVSDLQTPGEGKYVDDVLGEQWIPMISDWWRVPENTVGPMYKKGWACDNDVHEHFRVLAEQFISNAFVAERADGTLRTWNCHVKTENGKLYIIPSDKKVTRIHFNLRKKHEIQIVFAEEMQTVTLDKGMQWTGPGLKDYSVPSVYLWKTMMETNN